jgi:hypothetical protein
MSLISSASAAGLPFFYYHRLNALLSGIPRPAIQTCKFYYYSIHEPISLNHRGKGGTRIISGGWI